MARESNTAVTGVEQRVTDKRCFIATAVYGTDAWQTNALRRWRDTVLLPSASGRLLTRIYYRLSPCLAGWLVAHPMFSRPVRHLLDAWIRHLRLDPSDPAGRIDPGAGRHG